MDAANYNLLPEALALRSKRHLENLKACKLDELEVDSSIWEEVQEHFDLEMQHIYLHRQRLLRDTLSKNRLGTLRETHWQLETNQRLQGTYDSQMSCPPKVPNFEFAFCEADSSTLSSPNEYPFSGGTSSDVAIFTPQSPKYPSLSHGMATAVDRQQLASNSSSSTISNKDYTESEIGSFLISSSQSGYLFSGSASPDVRIHIPQLANHRERVDSHWYPRFNAQFLGNYNSESPSIIPRFNFAESVTDSSSTFVFPNEHLSLGVTSPDAAICKPQMSNPPKKRVPNRMTTTRNGQKRGIPGKFQGKRGYQPFKGHAESGPSTLPSFDLTESGSDSSSTRSSPAGYPSSVGTSPDLAVSAPPLPHSSSKKRLFNQVAAGTHDHHHHETRPQKRLREPTSILPLAEKKKRAFRFTDPAQQAACTEIVRLRNRLMLSFFGIIPDGSHYPELFSCMWAKGKEECPHIFDGHIMNSTLVNHFSQEHSDIFAVNQEKQLKCPINGCSTMVLVGGYEKHLRPGKARMGVVHGGARLLLQDASWETTKFLLQALKRAGYVFSFRNAGPDDWVHIL